MKNLFKTTLLTTALLGTFSATVMAQDAEKLGAEEAEISSYVFQDPVAKVNGREVSKSEFDNFLYITQGIAVGDIDSVEDRALAEQLLTLLGEQDKVADEAKLRGLDKTKDYEIRLKVIGDLLLSQALLEDMTAKNEFPEADIKALYDAEIAKLEKYEYQASHILVETEEEAQAILDAINKKEITFAEAAKEKSLDQATAAREGSLGGWFTASMMDQGFSEALVGMKKGEISTAPVQSSFGYHIIVLDDVKDRDIIPFNELDVTTKNQLVSTLFQKKLQEIQKDVTVELPEGK